MYRFYAHPKDMTTLHKQKICKDAKMHRFYARPKGMTTVTPKASDYGAAAVYTGGVERA